MGKKENTKNRIVDSAFKLIKENGINASIESICHEAGVSRGTFYAHFSSRDEIFHEIYSSINPDVLNTIPEILLADKQSIEKIWAIMFPFIKRTADCGEKVMQYVIKSGFQNFDHAFFKDDDRNSVYRTILLLIESAQQQHVITSLYPANKLLEAYVNYLGGLNIKWSRPNSNIDYCQDALLGFKIIMGLSSDFDNQWAQCFIQMK